MTCARIILPLAILLLSNFALAASLQKYAPSTRMMEQTSVQQRTNDDTADVLRPKTRNDMMDLKLIRSLEILRSQTPAVQRQ